jgi:hypothetical protein
MNSPPVFCRTSREGTVIFPEHMNSPLFCVGPLLVLHKTGGEFICSGKIAVLSLLVLHKTRGEFMGSGNIAVLSLLVPHKTGGEFMCSGKIAVPSLLVLYKTGEISCVLER